MNLPVTCPLFQSGTSLLATRGHLEERALLPALNEGHSACLVDLANDPARPGQVPFLLPLVKEIHSLVTGDTRLIDVRKILMDHFEGRISWNKSF